MDKRTLLNLGLAVTVAALGALVWFKPGTGPDEPEQPRVFGELKDLARIEVSGGISAGGTPATLWALERRNDGWWVTAPFVAPADAVEVETVIKALTETRSRARYAASALDPVATGLAKPELELVIDGVRHVFGGIESINYRRYLQVGAEVHLVDELLHYRLAQDPAGFASKRLLPPGARVTRLELPGRTLAAGGDGRWRVTPADPRISADALVALTESWSRAAALTVRARHDGVVQARVLVTLEGADAPLEFQVLSAVDGLVLARHDLGLEYALPDSARAELLELHTPPPVLPAAIAK